MKSLWVALGLILILTMEGWGGPQFELPSTPEGARLMESALVGQCDSGLVQVFLYDLNQSFEDGAEWHEYYAGDIKVMIMRFGSGQGGQLESALVLGPTGILSFRSIPELVSRFASPCDVIDAHKGQTL